MKKIIGFLCLLSSFTVSANDMQMAICAKVVEHFEGAQSAVPFVTYLAKSNAPRRDIMSYMEAAETIIGSNPQKAKDVYVNTCKPVLDSLK